VQYISATRNAGFFSREQLIAETFDAVEKLVAARVASLSTRRVERFENSCIGSVRVIPL
jgi:hypothetical protein